MVFDIIAGRIFPHLFKLDAGAAEHGLVLTRHQSVDHTATADVDFFYFFNQIRRQHGVVQSVCSHVGIIVLA